MVYITRLPFYVSHLLSPLLTFFMSYIPSFKTSLEPITVKYFVCTL